LRYRNRALRARRRERPIVATWNEVRRYALALPETSEATSSNGKREWRVNKKLFAWERPLRRGDLEALGAGAPTGPILAISTAGLEMKEALIGSNPRVYFTTPHFDGYAAVLLRLDKIAAKELREVMVEAWLTRAPKRAGAAFLRVRR
jgi:hypothetical protein